MRGGIVWTVFPFLGVLCVGLARQVEPVAARVAFGDSNTTIITALLCPPYLDVRGQNKTIFGYNF